MQLNIAKHDLSILISVFLKQFLILMEILFKAFMKKKI